MVGDADEVSHSPSPERPLVGQVVTVFRSRLRAENQPAYAEELAVIAALAREMPGYVEHKTFTAADGERATLVTFADAESHRAWRDHPRHREAQHNGISSYYSEYSIAVGETTHASSFRVGAEPSDRRPATAD